MSAQIPETMLLSDLLKATGYDCPEELRGRTFAEATAGGDVQTNKASTVDVSAYTEPIVIKPDTDYESMKKNTVTLSNIPVVPTLEDNKAVTIDVSTYTEPVEVTPSEGNDGMEKATVTLSNIPPVVNKLYAWKRQGYAWLDYTFSETPQVGDSAIGLGSSGSSSHLPISVYAITEVDLTATTPTIKTQDSYTWDRSAADDRDIVVH